MGLSRTHSESSLSNKLSETEETKKTKTITRSSSYPFLIKKPVPSLGLKKRKISERTKEREGIPLLTSQEEKISKSIDEEKAIPSLIELKIAELNDSSEQNILRQFIEIDYLVFTFVGVVRPSTVDKGSIYWNWIDGALSAGVGVHQVWKSRNYSYYKQSTQLKGVINFLSGVQSVVLSTSVFCHALPVWGAYLAFSISMLCDLIELLIDFYHISCLREEAKGQKRELTDLLDSMYEKTRNNLIAKAFGLAGAIFLTVAAFYISALILATIGTVLGALTATYYLFKHGEKTETGKYLKQKITSCASSFFYPDRASASESDLSLIFRPRSVAL